ncbi:MAG: S8 family serine peptidase [Bacteroidota bacterium]
MNTRNLKTISGIALAGLISASCSTGLKFDAEKLTPSAEVKSKNVELTEDQLLTWGASDLITDTIPGMSVDRAYEELIRDQEGKTVIVGVVDSGIDNEHEDLVNVMWVNPDEIADNGKDDDGNGYVDDIHGWNFLGDIVEENMEYVRIVRDYEDQFEGKTKSDIAEADKDNFKLYQKAKAEFKKEYEQAKAQRDYYKELLNTINQNSESLKNAMEVDALSIENLNNFETDSTELNNQKSFMLNLMNNIGEDLSEAEEQLNGGIDYYSTRLKYHFNKDLNARAENLGDDENDFSVTAYGNNQVSGPDPEKADAKHGTHVAGIIAADRTNDQGMKGVAQNVKIMAVRAVPDGDEYDKDIAMGIRYAVDNGAKVINTSFGKYFARYPEKVEDALRYAAENDVLIVNAAGNDAEDLDKVRVYPNDQTPENETEIVDNFINVGSITAVYGEGLVSGFSNYGKKSVDVFAPGSQIYSSTPLDEYEFLQGTSMAAPAVAGVAALIRSYYPKLSAAEVKEIIMESGISYDYDVIVGGDPNVKKNFSELSVSGKMVNLYNALILADQK